MDSKEGKYIRKALEKAKTKSLYKSRTDDVLRKLVRRIVRTFQGELKTKVNKIYFREMMTKWASYSERRNLTVNTLLKYLPDDLIEYVIYHEISLTFEKRHNRIFWSVAEKKFKDHQKREEDQFVYWFLVQKLTDFDNREAFLQSAPVSLQ